MNQCVSYLTDSNDCVVDWENKKCVTNTCKKTEDCKAILELESTDKIEPTDYECNNGTCVWSASYYEDEDWGHMDEDEDNSLIGDPRAK